MKGRQIVLDHFQGLETAALMMDGKLDDLIIDQPDAPRPGAIYRAICDRPLKGQGGMIMRLPEGETAFLRAAKGLRPGLPVLVQVTGYAEDGKAVPVTDRLLFKSRYVIVTPGRPGINISRQLRDDDRRDHLRKLVRLETEVGAGIILRSSCGIASDEDIITDLHEMLDLSTAVLRDAQGDAPEALTEGDGPHLMAWREWTERAEVITHDGSFEQLGVLDQIEQLRSPLVALNPGTLCVEATRAVIAIDVNSGPDTSPGAALKANIAAARALPRALRLRGLGGQIVVDFVSISKAHRKQVEQALRIAFKSDPVETSLVGWTSMGLFELQRKKERNRLRLKP